MTVGEITGRFYNTNNKYKNLSNDKKTENTSKTQDLLFPRKTRTQTRLKNNHEKKKSTRHSDLINRLEMSKYQIVKSKHSTC
ncbi:hypothetical protein IX39_19685 [Chryseobacterium formosense]|uniref:Uncharacterized protein n=1 Tax=Chryseobacterium formosense TaxID=236814 RepID=A0A085YZ91_9FLAO|nr:hypothetical protein IX39_19685 [Chryseobacterium formosense]SFT75522.1 hypothetical protein SAMN05421857_3055 [Chryseobacterium formosense]